MRSVVQIVTPSPSEFLTTLARVKRELNITDNSSDDILKDKIGEASSDVAQAIGKRLPHEDVRETFWHDEGAHRLRSHHHHGEPAETTLFLQRTPVTAIDSVTVDDVPLAETDYRLDPDAGLLDRLASDGTPFSWCFCRSVVVTYSAGFVLPGDPGRTLPAGIEGAVVALVSDYWGSRGRDPTLRSEIIPGLIERQFWVGAVGDAELLPPRVLASIAPFRRLAMTVA
jgi:hypothetical protein